MSSSGYFSAADRMWAKHPTNKSIIFSICFFFTIGNPGKSWPVKLPLKAYIEPSTVDRSSSILSKNLF